MQGSPGIKPVVLNLLHLNPDPRKGGEKGLLIYLTRSKLN